MTRAVEFTQDDMLNAARESLPQGHPPEFYQGAKSAAFKVLQLMNNPAFKGRPELLKEAVIALAAAAEERA